MIKNNKSLQIKKFFRKIITLLIFSNSFSSSINEKENNNSSLIDILLKFSIPALITSILSGYILTVFTQYKEKKNFFLSQKLNPNKLNKENFIELSFFKALEQYLSHGKQNNGLLLTGPPGTGKTESIVSYAKKYEMELFNIPIGIFVKNNGMIIINKTPISQEEFVQYIAEHRNPVALIDEIDMYCDGSAKLGTLLSLITELTKHKIPVIATTNRKIKEIPETLRRFGRLGLVIETKTTSADCINIFIQTYYKNKYLIQQLNFPEEELNKQADQFIKQLKIEINNNPLEANLLHSAEEIIDGHLPSVPNIISKANNYFSDIIIKKSKNTNDQNHENC